MIRDKRCRAENVSIGPESNYDVSHRSRSVSLFSCSKTLRKMSVYWSTNNTLFVWHNASLLLLLSLYPMLMLLSFFVRFSERGHQYKRKWSEKGGEDISLVRMRRVKSISQAFSVFPLNSMDGR